MLQQAYGVDLMDIVAGGHLTQNTMSWINDRTASIREYAGAAANSWLDQAKTFYSMIDHSSAVQAMRNMNAKKDNAWNINNIYHCRNVAELQTTNPVNQRYIMANPRLRDMYLNNQVEGYGDSYTNFGGNAIGERHFDFRRVMDGIVHFNDKDEAITHTFCENIPHGDKELELHQQVDALRNWHLVDKALDEHEEDPTSRVGNIL